MGASYRRPLEEPRAVGDVVTFRPTSWIDGEFPFAARTVTGRVIYVNRAHHYYTVEATVGGNTFRESFRFFER